MAELLQRWLATREGSVAPTSLEIYQQSAKRANRELGALPIAQLGPADLELAYANLRKSFAPDTVRGVHVVFRMATRAALRWGLLPRDPMAGVTAPPPGRPRQNVLSAPQLAQLLDATTVDRYHALWWLMATTGMTIGEATALSWHHLDLEARTVSIERICSMLAGRPTIREATKTRSRRRRITLSADTTAALQAHRTRQLTEQLELGPGWNPAKLVFCTAAGAPLSNHTARQALGQGLDRAGLHHIRLQDLRHTSATLLLAAGIHPKVAQERLGHSSITMTLNRYSHVMEQQHREADAVIDHLIYSPQPVAPDAVSGAVRKRGAAP